MDFSEFSTEISKLLRTSRVEVERLLVTAPYRYKNYQIEKRNGGKRDISHPTPALKAIQRWLVNVPLAQIPVHDAVYSYRNGRNIAMHAAVHVSANYIIRMDFKDFFPSIGAGEIRRFLQRLNVDGVVDLDDSTISSIVRLVCRRNKILGRLELSIGAPSSPLISNAILYNFDKSVSEFAATLGCSYTRYADDLYISSRDKYTLEALRVHLEKAADSHLPFLRFNRGKTQYLSRKNRMSITGINVSSDRKLSIGRQAKRNIRTRLHLALDGRLAPEDVASLRGMIAYAKGVEPGFYNSLALKFGPYQLITFMSDAA